MSNCPRPRTRPAAALAPASHEDGTMNQTTAGRRCRARAVPLIDSRLSCLKPCGQLPEVTSAVTALAISPDIVLKAPKEPETKGLAVGWPGQGTFIVTALSQVALPGLAGLRRPLPDELAAADDGLDEGGMVALSASSLRDSRERRGGPAGHGGTAGGETEGVA